MGGGGSVNSNVINTIRSGAGRNLGPVLGAAIASANSKKNLDELFGKIAGGVAVQNVQVVAAPNKIQAQVQAQPQKSQLNTIYKQTVEELKSLQQQAALLQQRIAFLQPMLVENFDKECNSAYNHIYMILALIIIVLVLLLKK